MKDRRRQVFNENAQKMELKKNQGGETLLMKTLNYR
jgi:hypothetical protein